MLKEKLDDWGIEYEMVDQTKSPQYMMYPQLELNGYDMLKSDTSGLTKDLLCDRMSVIWDNQTECDFGHEPL
tara:strand:- start:73 stop:288 length:216 start_codon:yes stop_codon:yes gene_type:complete